MFRTEEIIAKISGAVDLRRNCKKEKRLRYQSENLIQVMEFNNELYISYNGVPLINTKELSGEITEAINKCRETWTQWKNYELAQV